jgi:hypothetical protein
MRKVIITLALAASLAGCGAPVISPQCRPSVVQPARGAGITLVGRVAGCPNLVAVQDGTPGVILYVSRRTLVDFSDSQINALPEIHGEG